mgnify:CR=1 FL=1|jgi:hypothetical protein
MSLTITIKSYDEHFDTFACSFQEIDEAAPFDSLIPATLLPYIAPDLVAQCEDLPFDVVGRSFTLKFPAGALLPSA